MADLSTYGILGLDFMKEHHCSIDLHQDVLKFFFKLQFAGKMGFFRVSVIDDITISPSTGTVLFGKIIDFKDATDCHEGILELGDKFVERN